MLRQFFRSQEQVNRIVLDVSCMLGVPRHCLGITATSRGFIQGRLSLNVRGRDEMSIHAMMFLVRLGTISHQHKNGCEC